MIKTIQPNEIKGRASLSSNIERVIERVTSNNAFFRENLAKFYSAKKAIKENEKTVDSLRDNIFDHVENTLIANGGNLGADSKYVTDGEYTVVISKINTKIIQGINDSDLAILQRSFNRLENTELKNHLKSKIVDSIIKDKGALVIKSGYETLTVNKIDE